jgi:hypothetical protein
MTSSRIGALRRTVTGSDLFSRSPGALAPAALILCAQCLGVLLEEMSANKRDGDSHDHDRVHPKDDGVFHGIWQVIVLYH